MSKTFGILVIDYSHPKLSGGAMEAAIGTLSILQQVANGVIHGATGALLTDSNGLSPGAWCVGEDTNGNIQALLDTLTRRLAKDVIADPKDDGAAEALEKLRSRNASADVAEAAEESVKEPKH